MLQNTSKTIGFQKIMVYETPPGGGGGKPYLARGLLVLASTCLITPVFGAMSVYQIFWNGQCLNGLRVRTYALGNLPYFTNISSKETESVVTKFMIEPPGVK